MSTTSREHVDFLVLGGGVAGLSFALEAASHGSVLVLTKRSRQEGNTQYAQGGVAAVLGADNEFPLHVEDTLVAGAGLCHPDAVRVTVEEAPERIRGLQSLGVEFDRERPERAVPALVWLLPGIALLSVNTILMNYFASIGMPA